ncbi:MAG: lactate 2-monooxygenase [Actinobacteria bacterium]|nr:lactate 2-monooxygenase [Actinomycetota bacterium]
MNDELPQFGNFQHEIYLAGIEGVVPDLPVSYEALVERAWEELDSGAFGYVRGGAATEDSMRANRESFRRWRIVPRMLRDVGTRDLRTELFGRTYDSPVLLAPIGVQSIVHGEAEVAVGRAAAGLGVPMVLSTVSSYSMEEVASEMGDGPRWFQLYWPAERDLTKSLISRAEEAGYGALMVTLDTRTIAWRPRDLSQAYLPFLHAEGIANYTSDPVFLEGKPDLEDDEQATVLRWLQVYSDLSQTWEDLEWLCEQTDLPILVKGVLHPDDARRAVDVGVSGIAVSNHGGRQVDGAIGALDALPGIVEEVGDETTITFDSGIRSGADMVKALALGADAVMIGRPYVWGLGLAGDDGVRHVLRWLLADLDLTMSMSGFASLDDLSPDVLVRI